MERRIVELLRAGRGTNEVARELSCCKKRVRRVRELAEAHGYLSESVALPAYPALLFPLERDGRTARQSPADSTLESRRDWIVERLEADWHPITVFEELGECGVSRSSFYRYLARHGLNRTTGSRKVVQEILDAPGAALYVDFGLLTTVMTDDGKRWKVWAFVGVLGHSRLRLVRLMYRQDAETVLTSLMSFYEELGGVPARTVTDNPKVFSLLADRYEPVLNPLAERFAAHYGTLLECLPPRTPELKGKVERQMPYIRRLFEAHGPWVDIETADAFLTRKLILANQAPHGSTRLRPRHVFETTERTALRPLPFTPYEREEYHCGTVRQDGHVRFRNKYYSAGEEYIGKEVVVLAGKRLVQLFHEGRLIETHERVTDPYRTKSTKSHHLKPWERALEDHSYYRTRARGIGESVEKMVVHILNQGSGFIDYRRIWGILNLEKAHQKADIDRACGICLEHGRLSYRAVLHLLTTPEIPGTDSPTASATHTHKFQHSSADYAHVVQLELLKGGKRDEHRDSKRTAPAAQNAPGSERARCSVGAAKANSAP